MKLEILKQAESELNEAISHYEEIEPGLGIHLKEKARAALLWIQANPEILRIRPNGYRRVNLKPFPHYIAYQIRDDTIWILAITHGHRRPEYWIERKK